MRSDRLLLLAEHLEKGVLGHTQFDFGCFHTTCALPGGECGTAGCALGECPFLWPYDWRMASGGYPNLLEYPYESVQNCSMFWFKLSRQQAEYLFYPGSKPCPLTEDATKEAVAKNIRTFVECEGDLQKLVANPSCHPVAMSVD